MDARAHVDPDVREAPSVQRPLRAVVCVAIGLWCVSGSHFWPSDPPPAVTLAGIVEGFFWMGLGVAVWHEQPSVVRKCIALILAAMAIASLSWIVPPHELTRFDDLAPWKRIATSAICAALSIGLWRADEWARRAAIVAGVAYGAWLLATVTAFGNEQSEAARLLIPTMYLTSTATTIFLPYTLIRYCVQQSTREHFAEARRSR
jgi:hypothetical protein